MYRSSEFSSTLGKQKHQGGITTNSKALLPHHLLHRMKLDTVSFGVENSCYEAVFAYGFFWNQHLPAGHFSLTGSEPPSTHDLCQAGPLSKQSAITSQGIFFCIHLNLFR